MAKTSSGRAAAERPGAAMTGFRAKPDPHAAAMIEALMLRVSCRYMELRRKAEHAGADLDQYPPIQDSGFAMSESYEERVSEWLGRRPETGSAAKARIELAREILLREISDDDPIIDEHLDRVHAVLLLQGAADWANECAINDLVAEVREARS